MARSKVEKEKYSVYYNTRNKKRDLKIYHAVNEGYSVSDIAVYCGISRGRVYAIANNIQRVIMRSGYDKSSDERVKFNSNECQNFLKWDSWYGTYYKDRNLDIYNSWNAGVSVTELGKHYNLDHSTITSIVSNMRYAIERYGFESPEDESYAPSADILPHNGYKGCRNRCHKK